MNRIAPKFNTTAAGQDYAQQSFRAPTRKEKTDSFLTNILPMVFSYGLKASELSSTKPAALGDCAGFGLSKGTTPGSKGCMPDLTPEAKTGAWGNILGGILDIATSWGRSTPAKGAASGTAIGAAIGTLITPGFGTAVGAAIGAFAGGLLGSIKTGKHEDQKVRDQVRAGLLQSGIISNDYKLTLADGSQYDIGLDGGAKVGPNGIRPYEIDNANPMAALAVNWLSPLVALFSKGDAKVQSDFVGYLTNAALSNAKSPEQLLANVTVIMKQFGVNDQALAQGVVEAAKAGLIDEPTAREWIGGIEQRMAAMQGAASDDEQAK
jgi:uncharacterized protein YcfJ